MGRKGRKPWQEKTFRKNHEKLKEILSRKGKTTIAQLHKRSGLARRIVAKHLKKFDKEKLVVVEPHSWPRIYHWASHVELQIQAAKYKLLWEIENLPAAQKLEFLKLQKASGDPDAAKKLEALKKALELKKGPGDSS